MGSTKEHAEGECAGAVVASSHGVFGSGGGKVLAVMLNEPEHGWQRLRNGAGAAQLADGVVFGGGPGSFQSPCWRSFIDDVLQFPTMQ